MQTSGLKLQPGAARLCTRAARAVPSTCAFRAGPQVWRRAAAPLRQRLPSDAGRLAVVPQAAGGDKGERPVKYNTEFGYSRKDVILIGGGILGLGYGMYYGLQAAGLEPGIAGNFVQLFVILGISLGWVGSYLFRVATKQMTYVKQLEDYENAVMAKRLEEMPEGEMERLLDEVESEKQQRRGPAGSGSGGSGAAQ